MELIIIILLLVLLAEVTYLLVQNWRRSPGRKSSRQMFVDTSVLIDGRILAIAHSGFLADTLVIPRSVIGELQFLADNGDSDKRARARHGLDVVAELQAIDNVDVEIFPDGSKAEEGVDERLLKLAKQHSGVLCTIDYNLNKVAQVESIPVVNVNDLAMTLRMEYLPGEKFVIALTTKGNDSHQGVGHLEDGTMVVVEQAKAKIGQSVEVEVIRSLQTSAGRMMFARLVESQSRKSGRQPSPQGKKPLVQKQDKVEKVEKTDKKPAPKAASRSQQSAPATKPQKAQASSEGRSVTSQRKNTRGTTSKSPQRRKNNEDRLVELINSQE